MLNPASRSLTITEVESTLKVWLRSSGDREGGRNRRRRKEVFQEQQQASTSGNTYARPYVSCRRTPNSESTQTITSETMSTSQGHT